ncbi:ABC transporter substrate-binding protein [uncultured Ilumatobacter sp.]|jgi:ABC-type branched-subunit amino acid transport system substrate-binding protein|uniref:ABC transporter substrate-binding protein n=1 Tax=uncultured Ilumatobacter sp. TaxID=879968 RepID=UPI00374E8D13
MTRETTQRARSLRTIVAPLIAMTLVMAACGSDDAAEPAAEAPAAEPAAEPTGEPLKVMTVTTLNAAGPTYQNIANTAIAYQDYINARGGIAGRQLEVTVCDEQFDPAIATTCAREAVEEDMVSIVGSFTYFAESIVPVIAESSITWFGACCPITPSELSSPYSFNIGNQPMYAVGMVERAVSDGCKSINAIIIDGAQVFIPPMENAIKALGMSFGNVIILPPTAQDYSSEVAQATTNADCVVAVISETPFITWNTAWAQSGTDAQQYGPQGNLNSVSAAGAEEATDGNIIAGMYPDISTEPFAEYRVALDESGLDTTALDYNSLGGLGTWAAFVGFTQIAETINGEITAESFYQAADTTSNLDLNGMVPVLDFTQDWTDGLEGYNRLFNRSVVFSELDNGKVVPLTSEFKDVSNLATGTAD